MVEREVLMADGTKYPATMCGASNRALWITFVTDMTFTQMVKLVENPKKTAVIKYYAKGHEDTAQTFEGYTSLMLVQKMDDGYNVALTQKEE